MFVDGALTDAFLRGLILSGLALVWIVGLLRIVGLRSLSKMTNFDFVTTVAAGSLLAGAGQASDWPGFWQANMALLGLFALQWGTARVRRASTAVRESLEPAPMLLMYEGRVLEENMAASRVARSDLTAKLREANVLHPSEVRAVVLETTGDISVLHGEELDPALLKGVRGAEEVHDVSS